MSIAHAPYPYRNAYLDLCTKKEYPGVFYTEYQTELGSFDYSTDRAGQLMSYLLPGIEQTARSRPLEAGKIVRAEFIWKRPTRPVEDRGVVLWNNHGQAMIHVVNALLGYSGSGPALSQQILRLLGVPEELFEQANGSVAHQSYVIVFSRQSHSMVDDVDTAIPFAEPGEWEWWRVR